MGQDGCQALSLPPGSSHMQTGERTGNHEQALGDGPKCHLAAAPCHTHADLPSPPSLMALAPFLASSEVTFSASPCSTATRSRSSFLLHS